MKILGLMIGNALAYHAGLLLTLMGYEGGSSILMATLGIATAYILSRYVHDMEKILMG